MSEDLLLLHPCPKIQLCRVILYEGANVEGLGASRPKAWLPCPKPPCADHLRRRLKMHEDQRVGFVQQTRKCKVTIKQIPSYEDVTIIITVAYCVTVCIAQSLAITS